jgi:hypothetical protein
VTPAASVPSRFAHPRVHRSFTVDVDASRIGKNLLANQRRRFAQKSGFGERR